MNTAREEKARQSRKFIILVMFMFLISIAVFVVGTYFFVIPRLIELKMEVASAKSQQAVVSCVHQAGPGPTGQEL